MHDSPYRWTDFYTAPERLPLLLLQTLLCITQDAIQTEYPALDSDVSGDCPPPAFFVARKIVTHCATLRQILDEYNSLLEYQHITEPNPF
jgi:hypothetical protein